MCWNISYVIRNIKIVFLGLKMELLLSKLSGRDIHKVLIKERKPTSSLIIINIVGRINTYSR